MSLERTLASVGFRATILVERLFRSGRRNASPQDIRSILILEYVLPLGCCVHLTPLYEAIRSARPNVTISVATRGLGCALLRHHPAIDHLIETPDPFLDLPSAARGLRLELRNRQIDPDYVVTGASDQRTRIGLLAALACRGLRGGFTQAPSLYHRPLRVNRDLSLIDNNLRVAAVLGADSSHREPRVFFSNADLQCARMLVAEVNPSRKPLLVLVTQTSGGQRTNWHAERFARVIEHADAVLGCTVMYVGTRSEAEAIEELRARTGGIGVSLAGRTSPTQLAALLALSDCMVSLDTGTMHVGRAVGVPMVVISPSWQKPVEWLPLSISNVRILRGADRDSVPEEYRLDEIEADHVVTALTGLLEEHPPTAKAREARAERSLSEINHFVPRAI